MVSETEPVRHKVPDPPTWNERLDCLGEVDERAIHDLCNIFKQEHHFARVTAKLNQRKVARELGQDRKAVNGLGRVRMEVTLEAYHYWGQRLGYECWRDPQFLREFERDNPECRVKCGGTRTQVGHRRADNPAPPGTLIQVSSGGKRWSKSYGA